MSSKTVDPDPRLPLPAFLRRPTSLTGRLALLYVGSTAVLLLLAAGYLYWSLEDSLAREDQALLRGKLRVLRLLLREHNNRPAMLESEIEHEAAANELLKYYLRVLDSRGRVLMETTGMAGFLPVLEFPPPASAASGSPPILKRDFGPDRSYLLLTAEAGDEGHHLLQVALDVAHNDILLADYRWKLFAVLSAGLVFAALAGAIVARTGLKPLGRITRTVTRITASRLDERVTDENWPRELAALATAFDAMLDRLHDSFNRLRDCTGDMAHALRNPINNLRGEAEVALARVRTPEEYQQIIASSLEEHSRLAHMIDAMLFIARTDDPAATIEHTTFHVRPELDAITDFYEAWAAERQVSVRCEGDAMVHGDSILFRRAVSNLLSNALKHTPPGQHIGLSAGPGPDGGTEVVVQDSGIGISVEDLPRVLDRFYQVHKSRDQTAEGAGLGLAIVQSIMRLHGGSVQIESEAGRGTIVRLRFPAPRV
ncbi:MAG: heavy metal sensor histidine kinase [Opitutae bacterium]|nr:heavy metal sensor histidine kinase [Opitutae bacterium]